MTQAQRIFVGVIGAPHGVRGEVRIKSYTETPTALGGYRRLTTADGRTSFEIEALRLVKDDMVVARLKDVTTREVAAALTGTRLFLDRALLPPASDEEFYHADLIGLRVETPAGALLGRVSAILNFGGGDLLEVELDGGESLLVAFTKAFVPVVDLAAGLVVVASEALGTDEPDDLEPNG